jgi:putative peptidoglycan lipid II flippase
MSEEIASEKDETMQPAVGAAAEAASAEPADLEAPETAEELAGDEATDSSVGRSAAMMSALVIVSRLTGFLRTWGQAFALGTTLLSSCYTVANNLPNQLYELVIGGMLITAFLPVYLDVREHKGKEGANAYISNLLSILLIFLGVCFVLCLVFAAPLIWVQSASTDQSQMADGVVLFRFFAIEIVLYCLSSVASGILNAERDYFWSNAAPIFNNIITIASFVAFAFLVDTNYPLAFLILAVGNPLGVAVQVIMQIPSLRRHGIRLSFKIDLHDPALRETVGIGAPTLVCTACSFVTTSVMTSMALAAVPEQGGSIQYYARLWYTLPYAVLAVPITVAMFTEMSETFAKGDERAFGRQVSSGMSHLMLALIPFMIYLMVFSKPLMSLLRVGQFDAQSADLTAAYLSTLALALPWYGLQTFFQKVFSSMRRMTLFAVANVAASVVQVVFTIGMVGILGIHAVSLGSAVFMLMLCVISVAFLRYAKVPVALKPFVLSCVRSLALGIAGGAVGGAVVWALGGFGSLTVVRAIIVVVAGGIPSVLVTYGIAVALKLPEASFVSKLLAKFRR